MTTMRPVDAGNSPKSKGSEQTLSFVRSQKRQRIVSSAATLRDANFLCYDSVVVEDAYLIVSPDYFCDAVLYLVCLLRGVVATSDAIFTAIGMPDPAPHTKALERSAP